MAKHILVYFWQAVEWVAHRQPERLKMSQITYQDRQSVALSSCGDYYVGEAGGVAPASARSLHA